MESEKDNTVMYFGHSILTEVHETKLLVNIVLTYQLIFLDHPIMLLFCLLLLFFNTIVYIWSFAKSYKYFKSH
jgi:hypothetical protein